MTQLTLEQVAFGCYTAMITGSYSNIILANESWSNKPEVAEEAFNFTKAFIAERDKRIPKTCEHVYICDENDISAHRFCVKCNYDRNGE